MQGMIVDWIAHNAANLPDKTATVELPSGREQTYAQMHERVGRVAAWLISLGVKRGDRVGVLAQNISLALWTTAAGLLTAVPCVAVYYGFRNTANRIVLRMEAITMELVKDLRNVEVVEG